MQKKIKLKIKKFPIKINSNGEWFYNGSLIKKKTLIKLFSSILKADNNGNFFLETPAEKGSIEVEDSPFIIISFFIKDKGSNQKIIFRTNIDDDVCLGKNNPLVFKKNNNSYVPYIIVGKNLKAKILRSTYYQLIDIASKDKKRNKYNITSQGIDFELK